MVDDPRSQPPRPSEPQDPFDLLRELARNRAPAAPREQPAPDRAEPGSEKIESLRSLAETLDRQLRAAHGAAPDPARYPGEGPPDPVQDLPPRPARSRRDAWRRAAQFEWTAFRDGLPPARALVPRFRLLEIVFVAIAGAALVAGAIGAYLHHRNAIALNEPVVPPVPNAIPTPGTPPAPPELRPPTVADVKKAMSDCDAAAANDPDTLYFLVLPLLRTDARDTNWKPAALQAVGSNYALLGGNDALDAMRDGKAKVRPGRYTFAVLDTHSGATYSWTSATGMINLARKGTGGVTTFKLGFDFSPTQVGAQWSAEFNRTHGTCYWVPVLVQ
ncbi:MAG TPA: hypothetical protein VGG01_00450 [Xanthobacteraceae bacterium]|jgi:hypothetical protein